MRSGYLRGTLALSAFAACTFLLAQYGGSKPLPSSISKGAEAINVTTAKEYLGYLAGPECMGRGTGQPGYQKAAEYVAARLKEYGFKPAGDNGTYFQNVPFTSTEIYGEQLMIDQNTALVLRETQFQVQGIGENFTNMAEPIFISAGKGATTIEKADDIKGRIVIADISEAPRQFMFAISRAQPAMLIQVVDELPKRSPSIQQATTANAGRPRSGRGASGFITKEAAAKLAEGLEITDAWDSPTGETPLLTKAEPGVKLNVAAKARINPVPVPNVVGILEGSDPELKDEWVGIGAHLDHMGVSSNGTVYWGADDDGSGSTGVLLAAKAFAENPVKPKRSIVVMWFAAEEMGLIGSKYFTDNPTRPLDKMVCLFQMDMIGRNEETKDEPASENEDTIHLVGSKRTSSDLHQLILDTNAENFNMKFEYDQEDVYSRSDHYMFAAKGIPIAFFFDGFHPDYHQPTDTVDKINFTKLTTTAKLAYACAFKAANGERVKWSGE